MKYNLSEHTHRYAIWTASRAVQRSWTTTSKISQVIGKIKLKELVSEMEKLTSQSEFDSLHKRICNSMISEFDLLKIKASYGRVAKILAIYLKTSVIIKAKENNEFLKFIYPPIDRILLKNLPPNVEFKEVKKLNWTQLDFEKYWSLVNEIREKLGIFDWRLEIAWHPELDIEK